MKHRRKQAAGRARALFTACALGIGCVGAGADDGTAAAVPGAAATAEAQANATAAGSAPPSLLKEVTVTAQRFKQSARDVPISMSVMSNEFAASHGIIDIIQAMQFVPNVKIASGGFFAAPQARGFSFNNNNKAFESPLGIAFDGIPYSNTTYFNAGLFDIDRLEVLRGPQGTTFGKNTTAGLVSIITADPTPEYTGVMTQQNGQFRRLHTELAVGGPIIPNVADFRVAYMFENHGGVVQDTTAATVPGVPAQMRGYSRRGYRAKLKFPDLLGTDLKLQYETVDLDNTGGGVEIWKSGPAFRAFNRLYDPHADFTLGNWTNSEDGPDFRFAHVNTALAEWNVPIGSWRATALGGYSVLKETLGVDTDFSPVPGINGDAGDKFPTTSLELRAQSPSIDGLFGLGSLFGLDLGRTEFLGGLFFQRRSITNSYFHFTVYDVPFLGETAAAEADAEASGGPAIPLGDVALPGGVIDPRTIPSLHNDEFTQNFDQDGSVFAVFGQAQWKIRPQWILQLGMRVSRERKKGYWNLTFDSPPPSVVLTALGLQQFMATEEIGETQFAPKVSLNYRATKQVNLFLHWTRGFKGGGFNAFAYDSLPSDLVFLPEVTNEWGFDAKSTFLHGRLRANVSLYRMTAHNFQVLGREKPPVAQLPIVGIACGPAGTPLDTTCLPPSVIGLGTTKVFNAPLAHAQGVEGDLTWVAGNGASLFLTIGYNDTKYNNFTQNECAASNSAPTCDATGRPFAFAPRWDTTLTPSWAINLPWDLTLTPSVTAEYISSELLDTDLGEDKRQGGFLKYNASLSLGDVRRGWSFSVMGNNLTNKATSVRYGDVFGGVYVAVPESPREVFGQLRWAF